MPTIEGDWIHQFSISANFDLEPVNSTLNIALDALSAEALDTNPACGVTILGSKKETRRNKGS